MLGGRDHFETCVGRGVNPMNALAGLGRVLQAHCQNSDWVKILKSNLEVKIPTLTAKNAVTMGHPARLR